MYTSLQAQNFWWSKYNCPCLPFPPLSTTYQTPGCRPQRGRNTDSSPRYPAHHQSYAAGLDRTQSGCGQTQHGAPALDHDTAAWYADCSGTDGQPDAARRISAKRAKWRSWILTCWIYFRISKNRFEFSAIAQNWDGALPGWFTTLVW